MSERTCDHRWRAGRVEVPDAIVLHVCGEPEGHQTPHRCSCKAWKESDVGMVDWFVALFALAFVALLFALGVWAIHGPSGEDRIQHCIERGGTVRLDRNDEYDGCFINHE